jgi:hypothetical protein
MDLTGVSLDNLNWIRLTEDREDCEEGNERLDLCKTRNFLRMGIIAFYSEIV